MPVEREENISKPLVKFLAEWQEDINTRIPTSSVFNTLMLWRICAERKSTAAKKFADVMEKLLWSLQGKSRDEAVQVLQKVPRETTRLTFTGPVPEEESILPPKPE